MLAREYVYHNICKQTYYRLTKLHWELHHVSSGMSSKDLVFSYNDDYRDATYSTSLIISGTSTTIPASTISHGNLSCPLITLTWLAGYLTFTVAMMLDMTGGLFNGTSETVPGSGVIAIRGCNQSTTSPSINVKIANLATSVLAIGSTYSGSAVPFHQGGTLAVDINRLWANNFYVQTLVCSGSVADTLRPR